MMLPIVLWLLYRKNRPEPFRRLPALFLVTAVLVLILRIRAGWPLSGDQYYTYLCPTHLRIDSLFFGVLLRYYYQFKPEVFSRIRHSRVGLAVIALAWGVLLAGPPLNSPFTHTFGLTLIFVGFGLWLARVIDRRPGLFTKVLAPVGRHSYSIYLWHIPVSYAYRGEGALAFAVLVALSLVVGFVMARLIEFPTIALRDRLVPSTPPIKARAATNETESRIFV